MRRLAAIVLAIVCACLVHQVDAAADPAWAVVRIPSHGASGTIVATGQGWSLILTCAHAFEGPDRHKSVSLDLALPRTASGPSRVGVEVLRVDPHRDLAMLRLNWGPAPYVCPIAPPAWSAVDAWSIGCDEMRLPPLKRPARILSAAHDWTETRERPWHGRSGGALVDTRSGWLVGVVSGYTGPQDRLEIRPGAVGIYASHSAVLSFLRGLGYEVRRDRTADALHHRHMPATPFGRKNAPVPAPIGSTPFCPGGT